MTKYILYIYIYLYIYLVKPNTYILSKESYSMLSFELILRENYSIYFIIFAFDIMAILVHLCFSRYHNKDILLYVHMFQTVAQTFFTAIVAKDKRCFL